MPSIYGDWFHSRTGSQLSELAAIQLLVVSSHKTEYIGKNWGADRRIIPRNAWIFEFSASAKLGEQSIQPSTMQTKIRNWIRLGFLRDSNVLPLEWTQLGHLWSDAVDSGRGGDANLLYELIIANALGLVSFSPNSKYVDKIPQESGLLLKFLIQEANKNYGNISKKRLEELIDGNAPTRTIGKNYSYWTTDLSQTRLFEKREDGSIELGRTFPDMIDVISSYVPSSEVTAQMVKDMPLAIGAPFQVALINEFKKYGSDELIDAIETFAKYEITLNAEEQRRRVLSNKQLQRTGTWSKVVKNNYNYHCAIPDCDAQGTLFIQAAHIMPFSAGDTSFENIHRNDIENGVALCLSCHKMFDAGLFTFDEKGHIVASNFIYSSELIQSVKQQNVLRILNSRNQKLISPEVGNFNAIYASFHREHIFLGE